MAADPFRSLFLRQVRTILSGDPNRDSLRLLLATAAPEVTDADLDDETTRNRIFKELRTRVHPDKHPNDDTATSIFQDVPPFYEACCRRLSASTSAKPQPSKSTSSTTSTSAPPRRASMSKEKETTIPQPPAAQTSSTSKTSFRPASTTTSRQRVSLPAEFKVVDKWPFLSCTHPIAPKASVLFANTDAANSDSNSGTYNKATLELLVAYQCINARGAVAHGAKPGLLFGYSKVTAEPRGTTAEQLLETKFRGVCRLDTPDTIKEELMSRGPVVSVSFVLSQVLKQHGGGTGSAIADSLYWQQRMNQTHAVMIVGWKLTAFGEVWLVHPPILSDSMKNKSPFDCLIPIAFGQFGIDTLCLAPASDLLDKAWQPGPFLDLNLSKWPGVWMSWKKCDVHLTANELQRLSECLASGFVSAATGMPGRKGPSRFVLRDEKKLAHSRAFCLKDVQWNPDKKMWKITVMRHATD